MKIGKFAEKHNITQDTVRHYLDLELLVTEKSGGHFKFSDSDSRDIEKIIEFKNLGFSLNDIQKILSMQRISGENTNSFRKFYLSFLENKKKEVDNIVLNLVNLNNNLKEKIQEIKCKENEDVQKLGFCLSSLHLLECPLCHKQLTLSNGTIEKNNIVEANFQCQCGYTAEIKDGIYIDKRCIRTKLLYGERMPSKEEYLAATTPSYSNFLYKGIASLIEHINNFGEKEPKYIIELENCVGFFLMQYIKYLPRDTTHILIDYDYERLANLKKDLENYYNHKNFIFLCCDYENIPLKNSSVDMVIDYMMTSNYEQSHGVKLFDVILPKIKNNGIICGAYLFIENIKSGNNIDTKGLYNKDKIVKLLNDYKIELLDSSIIGPLSEGQSFNRDVSGQDNYQGTYIGKTLG